MLIGENLGNTMKQPKLSELALNIEGTKKIRDMTAKSQKVKITINIDKNSLDSLKEIALKSGGSYQKILNEIVKNGIDKHNDSESRLQKLEKEVAKIKKKLTALYVLIYAKYFILTRKFLKKIILKKVF